MAIISRLKKLKILLTKKFSKVELKDQELEAVADRKESCIANTNILGYPTYCFLVSQCTGTVGC